MLSVYQQPPTFTSKNSMSSYTVLNIFLDTGDRGANQDKLKQNSIWPNGACSIASKTDIKER